MKINYFAVNNFRGISGGLNQNTIEFKDTNTLFIYGQNNVGKSTFLKAYQYFYLETVPTQDDFFRKDFKNQIEFELEVSLDQYDMQRVDLAAPNKNKSFRAYLSDSTLRIKKIWAKQDKVKAMNLTFNPVTGEFDEIAYGSVGLHQVFQSCMPKPIFIKAMPTEVEAKSILNDILKIVAEGALKEEEQIALKAAQEKIKELQDKMYNPKTVKSYEQSVNSYFSKIFSDTQIQFRDSKDRVLWTENKLGKDFDIEFHKLTSEGGIDTSIPTSVDSIGHGTIRTAIFTLLLMKDVAEKFERTNGRKDYMVLFEELELFLYPRIVRELRDLIYQVSEDDLPYQVLCASHSAAMIDLSKPRSSIIRLEKKGDDSTTVHQINDQFLKSATSAQSDEELRQEMYEVLRFNPFICESFYADDVLLIEGPTEEIIARAFFQVKKPENTIFVLNCGSVTNIPFYQRIFAKFGIRYHVVCDTDGEAVVSTSVDGNPIFETGIQGTISGLYHEHKRNRPSGVGIFRVHHKTFEPAHMAVKIPEELRFTKEGNLGKPYNANLYWKNKLQKNLQHPSILEVPMICYLTEVVSSNKGSTEFDT